MVTSPTIIKSKTNDNQKCKQYFVVAGTNRDNVSLTTVKYILSRNPNISNYFEMVKVYKHWFLHKQQSEIKLKTLQTIIGWINSLKK
jgi:hypothetical protein